MQHIKLFYNFIINPNDFLMKIKRIYFLLTISFFCFLSCNNSDDLVENAHDLSNLNSGVSEKELMRVATKFVADVKAGSEHNMKTRAYLYNTIYANEIDSAVYFDSEGSSTRVVKDKPCNIYAVAMNNNLGSVVLSKEGKRIIPLVYFENNNVNLHRLLTDSISEDAFLLQSTLENYYGNIKEQGDIYDKNLTRSLATQDEIIERVEPKCKVAWSQRAPYNKYVNMVASKIPWNKKGDYPAGCVAVAGAQALTVLRPSLPNFPFLWDDIIKENPTEEVLDAISLLICRVGIAVDMDYDLNGSSANTAKLVSYFNNFGIKDYDAPHSIDVLKTPHGIIVVSGKSKKKKILLFNTYTGGHAFIADGYIKYNRKSEPYYLHLNYGWGPDALNRNAYVLNDNKWYDESKREQDASNLIYRYNIKFYCFTYVNEKKW